MGGDTVGPIPPRCCTDAVPRCRVRRTTGDPMRRFIAPSAASGRWRRRRSARIALAGALVVVAPFVGGPGGGTDKFTDYGTGDGLASGEHSGHPGPSGGSGTLAGFTPGHSPGFPDAHAGSPGAGDALRVVPVPLADPAVADVLEPGDRIDLVAVTTPGFIAPDTGPANADTTDASPTDHPPGPDSGRAAPILVARSARVHEIPPGRAGARTILVEVPASAAVELAATAAGTPLAVIVHG